MLKIHNITGVMLVGFLIAGCAGSKGVMQEYLKQENCSAFNLISLFASNPNVKEIQDFRKEDQKTYENSLFSIREYCMFGNYRINDIINEYERRTDYKNSITYNNGVVVIDSSNRKYFYLDNSFNFVAISKNQKQTIHFKNRQKVKLGKKTIFIEVLKDYKNKNELYELVIHEFYKQGKVSSEKTEIIRVSDNFFVFDDFLIVF